MLFRSLDQAREGRPVRGEDQHREARLDERHRPVLHLGARVGLGVQAAGFLELQRGLERGKTSSIVVMAEGRESGGSMRLAEELKKRYGIEAKVCIIGHVQRGGSPTARDRRLGSIMGVRAVEALLGGFTDAMVGVQGDHELLVPFPLTVKRSAKIRHDLIEMAKILAT